MKKIGLILLTLAVFNISYAAKEKVDTTFTFQNFAPNSADVVSTTDKRANFDGSSVIYPLFSSGATIKEMNKNMEKFVSMFKGNKNETYKVSYRVTGNNAYFVSILFDVTKTDKKNNTVTNYNEAASFNIKNGKILQLKDLFINGYNDALNAAVNGKIKQFGLETLDGKKNKFEGIAKSNQKFYMEDDAIIIFFNQGKATDFGNGQLFIPFITTDLIGILK